MSGTQSIPPTQEFKAGFAAGKKAREELDAKRIEKMRDALVEAREALRMLGGGEVAGKFVPVQTLALRIVNKALRA